MSHSRVQGRTVAGGSFFSDILLGKRDICLDALKIMEHDAEISRPEDLEAGFK